MKKTFLYYLGKLSGYAAAAVAALLSLVIAIAFIKYLFKFLAFIWHVV